MLAYNTQLGIKYIGKKKASTYHLSHDHHFTRKITTKFPSLKTHKGQAHTHNTELIVPTNPTPQIRSPQHSTHSLQY